MRVAVIGVGSIGGHLAARLASSGVDVTAVARGETAAVLRTQGLRLDAGDESLRVRVAVASAGDRHDPHDVVVVATKAVALRSTIDALRVVTGPATRVVFAQNGMTWWYPIGLPASHPPLPDVPPFGLAAEFAGVLAREQVVGGVVYSANEVVAPGHVRNNSPGHNQLEIASLLDPGDATVIAFRAALSAASVASPVPDDLRAALWLKLVGNASASPLAVATGDAGAIRDDERVRETFERMADEVMAVARACGYDVSSRFSTARWTANRPKHPPSMLQDFLQHRPMELDEIVLAPIRLGRHLGVPVPTLEAIAAVVVHRSRAQARPLTAPAPSPHP